MREEQIPGTCVNSWTYVMQQSLRKFSFETAHYGKSSTSFFQNIFTSTDTGFISGAGLTTKSIKLSLFASFHLKERKVSSTSKKPQNIMNMIEG